MPDGASSIASFINGVQSWGFSASRHNRASAKLFYASGRKKLNPCGILLIRAMQLKRATPLLEVALSKVSRVALNKRKHGNSEGLVVIAPRLMKSSGHSRPRYQRSWPGKARLASELIRRKNPPIRNLRLRPAKGLRDTLFGAGRSRKLLEPGPVLIRLRNSTE